MLSATALAFACILEESKHVSSFGIRLYPRITSSDTQNQRLQSSCTRIFDSFKSESESESDDFVSHIMPERSKLPSKDSPRMELRETDGADQAMIPNEPERLIARRQKLEAKLMKQLRQSSLEYRMIEDNDHIMCCISGGKDSATLLHLLLVLRSKLEPIVRFRVTAVHLNQMQPGYDGASLYKWLDSLGVPYRVVDENTFSVVKEKTPENKTFCSLCSRLRRGILYSVAQDIGANKLALGHHGDDAIETLLLNLIHNGQMKAMPARYYSTDRDMHVIRPLIHSFEEDIAEFAKLMEFPILPCNLCGTQPDAQRAKVKLLCHSLEMLNPNAKKNVITAMGNVRPSHLLDLGLREACGLDSITGEVVFPRAHLIRGFAAMNATDDGKVSFGLEDFS